MFGWPAFEGIQAARVAADPESAAKKEAMDKVEREGQGICQFCDEEIIKNEGMPGGGWVWESEFMLGFCNIAKDKKHKPKVVWTAETGVTVAETRTFLDPTNEREPVDAVSIVPEPDRGELEHDEEYERETAESEETGVFGYGFFI